MLNIENIEEFRNNVAHKDEIREMNIGNGSISFCYMIAAADTFNDAWARECRGIVFSEAGEVTGRPMHKFFNVGERESTRVENIDWSQVARVMDKRDGSMIHTVATENGVMLKSKKTFESQVALDATAWVEKTGGVKEFITNMADLDMTAIFEWTAPDARIVLFYPESKLTLLHIRDNMTGEYISGATLREMAASYDVAIVDDVTEFWNTDGSFNHVAMMDAAQTREGVEGWIVQMKDGEMVKVKTSWYLKRHRAMTFLRERDIAQLVLDEGLDDLKSLLVSEGVNIDEILTIEARVLHDMRELAMSVDLVYNEDKGMARKDFAMKHNDHAHFGLIMHKYVGRQPAFKDYFEKNMLRENYGLRQLSLVPTVAEGDNDE